MLRTGGNNEIAERAIKAMGSVKLQLLNVLRCIIVFHYLNKYVLSVHLYNLLGYQYT